MNKKRLVLFLPIIGMSLTSCSLAGVKYETKEYVAGTLKYKEDFRILQLTDIHLGNKDDIEYHLKFIQKTIDDAHADLIVVTGDVFTLATKSNMQRVFKFFEDNNTPWTMTWGNHDEQNYASIDWMTGQLNKLAEKDGSKCIFKDLQDDDVFGNANFVINLTEDGTANSKVKQQLIVLDSNRYNFKYFSGYDCVHTDQVEWYKRVVTDTKTANGGQTVPSLAFFHIPFPEFQEAYDLVEKGDASAKKVDADKWAFNEDVCCPKFQEGEGLYKAMKDLGSTKGCFVGHDHINTFVVDYGGIYLAYGIKATTRIYYENDLMGGQVVSMNSANQISIQRYFHTYDELEAK